MTFENPGGPIRLPVARSRYRVVNELAEARVAQKIARIDLAEAVGYHVMILGRYERGETTPSLQRLVDWAEALGFDVALVPKD